jgi:biotin-dependent carboxylase-like uncharacterized protein
MIKVLKSGFYTSIQDRGRVGFASVGVPVSGVMDSYSADLSNSVLNNSLKDAVLEITFGGCKLEFLTETIICISGGDFSPKINNLNIAHNSSIKVKKNDKLTFGYINFGVRCYLAVKNGFRTEVIFKSRSFYKNITSHSIIQKKDVLPFLPFNELYKNSNSTIKVLESHFKSQNIECNKGPEYDLLEVAQKKQLLEQLFTISKDHNRMGYKLNEIIKNKAPTILTSAVFPGTVQLTPSGILIILMRDCQVTGGYPRVLQLSKYSIDKLAQKSSGDQFQFIIDMY